MHDRRILVVDDEEDIRATLAAMLEERGAQVFEASSGDEALTILSEQEAFDLVVTDVVMGAPFGTQLAAMVRTADYHGPILVITAHRDSEFAETVKKIDNAELLYKPFDSETFLRRVRDLLEGHGAETGDQGHDRQGLRS